MLESGSDFESEKVERRGKRKKRGKRKSRSSSRRRSRKHHVPEESESEDERRRRKRREREERDRKRRKREKEKEETSEKEFTAWLLEVNEDNFESLPPWEAKKMFKDVMEDHNTGFQIMEKDDMEIEKSDAEKRGQSLKKDVRIATKCIYSLEKTLHEIHAECVETNVFVGSKMSEAHTMIEDALKKLAKLLNFCKNKKNEMNNFVHSYMQRITYVTYVIKDAKLQFHVLKEAMAHQDDLFADLKLVRGVGSAYRACLAEVVRRKASMKFYMGMAGKLAEKLAMKRETEVRRCEDFHIIHGPFVPRDVLASMGLYATPTQCDDIIAPNETSFINIEIVDVDRYAPEYLVGLHSKVAFSRSPLGMSSDSSLSAEAEEIGLNTLEKDSFDDILEVSELVEIAGTSKMKVENAKLKAELASAISWMCSLGPKVEYVELDESGIENLLKNAAEKTAEALQAKDECRKHHLSMLKEKQRHRDSYEKRIRELEQRLTEEYLQRPRHVNNTDVSGLNLMHEKVSEYKAEASGALEGNKAHASGSEPMDEVLCVSNISSKQPCKGREGMDENMVDSSLVLSHPLDSSMLESQQNNEKGGKDNVVGVMGVFLSNNTTAESPPKSLGDNVATGIGLDTKYSDDVVLELRNNLMEKSNKLNETRVCPAEEISDQYGGFKRDDDTEFSNKTISEVVVKSGSSEIIEIPAPEVDESQQVDDEAGNNKDGVDVAINVSRC